MPLCPREVFKPRIVRDMWGFPGAGGIDESVGREVAGFGCQIVQTILEPSHRLNLCGTDHTEFEVVFVGTVIFGDDFRGGPPRIWVFQRKVWQFLHPVGPSQGAGLPTVSPCTAGTSITIQHREITAGNQTAAVQCSGG